jgi:hypothetical protein
MPVWVMRACGAWAIIAGVGQFFLIRYLPWRRCRIRDWPLVLVRDYLVVTRRKR